MANPLDFLRFQNIFDPSGGQWGNDLPSQGGITGNLPGYMPPPAITPQTTQMNVPPSVNPLTPALDPTQVDVTPQSIAERAMKLYTPESAASEKFNQLVNQYPQQQAYRPSVMRSILSALTEFGSGGHQAAQQLLYQPYQQKLSDWQRQIGPAQQAANLERYQNINERQFAYQTAQAQLKEEAQKESAKIAEGKLRVSQQRTDAYEFSKMHPNVQLIHPKGGNIQYLDPITKQPVDLLDREGKPIATGTITEQEMLNKKQQDALERIRTAAEVAPERFSGGIQTYTKDENGQYVPGPVIQTSTKGGPAKEVTVPGGGIIRPTPPGQAGQQLTTATRARMENAQYLRPHIPDVANMAAQLDRSNLFGPVMSRLRDLGAKLGTVELLNSDDPATQQKAMMDFARGIDKNIGLLNTGNDALVGRFLTNVKLLTSGMAMVHGGQRGGGSINMLNYMGTLLNPDSTLDMFRGNLMGFDDFLSTYAKDPRTLGKETEKSKFGNLIEDVLSGKPIPEQKPVTSPTGTEEKEVEVINVKTGRVEGYVSEADAKKLDPAKWKSGRTVTKTEKK